MNWRKENLWKKFYENEGFGICIKMKLIRISLAIRLISIIFSIISLIVSWRLRNMSLTGVEDVPPPFILLAFIAGILFFLIGVFGKILLPVNSKHIK